MRIVSLSTYPVSRPVHGGQRRVDALRRTALEAGCAYLNVPVFFSGGYPDADMREQRTALPDALRDRLHDEGRLEDLHLSRVISDDLPVMEHLAAQILAFRPDVVQLEHPWLFPVFERLVAQFADMASVRLVYSAHNVETDLAPARFRDEVRVLEQRVTARADLVIAVSEADAAVLRGWTDPRRKVPVIVAPNGCWLRRDADVTGAPLIDAPYVMVAGSAHPPNANGFWDSFGVIPGCIPPGGQLVVAGGVCDLLRADSRFGKFRMLNDALVRYMGVVDDADLTNLLHHARGICLPITEGGGTNLKTAEALVSLKPVVGRPAAFRGFEEALCLPGVHVADTAQAFRHAVRRVFSDTTQPARRPEDVSGYTWPETLKGLGDAYRRMRRGSHPAGTRVAS